MLSDLAREVLDVLEEVRMHPSTEKYIEEQDDIKDLPIGNILNEHIKCDSEEYKTLLNKVYLTIHGNLISSKNGNSSTYYELKKAGYNLRVFESDGFGPLTCGIKVPNTDYWIFYG